MEQIIPFIQSYPSFLFDMTLQCGKLPQCWMGISYNRVHGIHGYVSSLGWFIMLCHLSSGLDVFRIGEKILGCFGIDVV